MKKWVRKSFIEWQENNRKFPKNIKKIIKSNWLFHIFVTVLQKLHVWDTKLFIKNAVAGISRCDNPILIETRLITNKYKNSI